ncbi:MAG: carbamoyltransferase [Candidatus Omnitrophota bacterium]
MKPVYILGISAFYHDAAAALLKDGDIIAAAQEERFTRKKHDHSFPQGSIDYCLKEAGIAASDISYVAFYDKPFVKFERLLMTYLSFAPWGIESFVTAMPPWIKEKIFMRSLLEDNLKCPGKILFPDHHESHAGSAFYPSPFQDAAILTVDGVGEWSTASYGIGSGKDIKIIAELKFPHSLGLLYSAFTYYVGFKVNSGEYKLMGLAPYGEPKYADIIKKELINIKEDGSFRLNMRYFNYCTGLTMTNRKFDKLFGSAPRKPESEKVKQFHMDIARSVQSVTEEVMLRMGRHIHRQTGQKNLCLAGGVALNCVANGRLLREGPFDKIWIQPSATDAGGALGAALVIWHRYLKKERRADNEHDSMKAALLGPEFSDEVIEEYLMGNNIIYKKLSKEDVPKSAAKLIADEKVLGWFQGRLEYGPRALGSRSIVGDPRSEAMQGTINLKIKFRESFRPFAPTVLADKASDYFALDCESPYMLLVAPVKDDKRLPMTEEQKKLFGIDRLKIKRSSVPAVTHVDYSARIQTVKRKDNPIYYDMINEFFKITGCPVIINTSFNVRGEPIVCTPEDAYRCFMRTNMDYLIMGSFLLDKSKQPESEIKVGDLSEFEPD